MMDHTPPSGQARPLHFFEGLKRAAKHEVKSWRHRKPLLFVSIVMPLVWLVVLGTSLGGPGLLQNLPVSWVSPPVGTLPRELVQTLEALPAIRWEHVSSIEAQRKLTNLETYATLTIPEDFARRYARGEHPTVELTLNKAIYGPSSTLEYDIQKAVSHLNIENLTRMSTLLQGGTLQAQADRLRLTEPELRNVGNLAFNFNPYLLFTLMPGLTGIAAALTFVSVISRALRTRAQTWPVEALRPLQGDRSIDGQLGHAPLARRMGALPWCLGTVLPWLGVMLLMITGVVVYLAGIDGWALTNTHLLGWLVAGWLMIGATLGIVLFFCGIAPNWLIATFMTTAFFAPAFPFTGFSFPLESMTPGAAFYGHLIPLTHYLRGQAIAWTLSPSWATLASVLWPLVAIMLVTGITGLARLEARYAWPSLKEKEGQAKRRAQGLLAQTPSPHEGDDA